MSLAALALLMCAAGFAVRAWTNHRAASAALANRRADHRATPTQAGTE